METAESRVDHFEGESLLQIEREGLLSIVIGTAGHRDVRPEDVPRIEERISEMFKGFQTTYPHTPVILLNSLADGADRIVARTSLQHGVKMIAVLPMPRANYEEDFETEESKQEFSELLARCEYIIELPLRDGSTEATIMKHSHDREMHYEQAAAFVVRNSHMLLALWDGVKLARIGGTSRSVDFMLHGVPQPYAPPPHPLDPPEGGPVYQIVIPRVSNPIPEGHPFAMVRHYPPLLETKKRGAELFDEVCERIEVFNEDAEKLRKQLAETREKSKGYVLPPEEQRKLSSPLKVLLNYFATADSLAQYYQQHTTQTLKYLFIFAFLALTSFNVFSHIFHHNTEIIIGFLVFMVVAYLWGKRAEKHEFHNKYLDYRALAEGFRVQLFWRIGGITESAADYYIRKQKGELDWIRNAMRLNSILKESTHTAVVRTAAGEIATPHMSDSRALTGLRTVLKFWVEDQAKYFGKVAIRDKHRLHKLEKQVEIFFILSVVMAVVQLLIDTVPVMVFLIETFTVIAAFTHNFTEKNTLHEHVKQYERMSLLYSLAKRHLTELLKDDQVHEARVFLSDLGKESLAENGDWLLVHRQNPLEVPK